MGLAVDTIDVIATAMEISNLDLEISLIDNRRQRLSFTIQDLSTEFSTRLSQKNIDLSDDLATDDEKDDLELDWEQFKIEYDVAMAKLNSQDKVLEEERTKLESKRTMLSTHLESAEKRQQKNAESAGKGLGS